MRGVGSWAEVRELSLAQIRVALAACERRDASLAIQALETTHAANAPLLVGKSGTAVYEKCVKYLIGVISPAAKKEATGYGKMLAKAREDAVKSRGGA